MKLNNIFLLFFLFILSSFEIISAQYAVTLNNSSDTPTVPHVRKITSQTSSNVSSDCSYNEINESSTHLESKNPYPTFTDVYKVAKTPASNFIFAASQTVFPYEINNFIRKQIIISKKDKDKVSALYTSVGDPHNHAVFTISLIPIGFGTEGRLRDAFEAKLVEFSKEEKMNQKPIIKITRFNGKAYKPFGISAFYKEKNKSSGFIVYECGSWLMEMTIMKLDADILGFQNLHHRLVQIFNPSQLTAVKPLYEKANLEFKSEGLEDPIMTGALWASAMSKIRWASSETSWRERASGFPDLYLDMHISALKEYLRVQSEKQNLNSSSKARMFYNELLTISNAGFLPEYIMEQYNNVMIVPSNIHLNFEAYQRWKKNRDIQVDIRKKLYNISYRNLPY